MVAGKRLLFIYLFIFTNNSRDSKVNTNNIIEATYN